MLIAISVGIVLVASVLLWRSPVVRRREIRLGNFVGATVLAAWSVGVGAKFYQDRFVSNETELVRSALSIGASAWNEPPVDGTNNGPRPATTAPTGTAIDAPPIPSLIGGLETRLAQQPDDAKGWALLAQSYAFVGDSAGAERALGKAVELGMDEADLRRRVESSTRDPHPGNWIQQAVGR